MAITASRLRRAVSLSSSLLHRHNQTPLSHALPPPLPQLPVSRNPNNTNSFLNFLNCRGFRVCGTALSSRPSRTASYGNSIDDNKISPDEILFEGCDYNHWLITMDFPKDPKPSPEEMVETYVQTAAQVFGSVEEAKKKIYACSTTTYEGFQVEISEQDSEKFKGLPGVVFVLPDSYIDPVNKEYGGDKYINGTIIHRPPPVSYGRTGGRYGDRNRDYNRPNRQESMQGDSRNFGPPQSPPPQQNYGPPRVGSPQQNYGPPRAGPPQQNYGPPRAGPPQQNYGPPGGGRDATPMSYSPGGNENYQGDGRNPIPVNQANFNQGQGQNSYPPGQRGFPPVEQANLPPDNRNFTSTQGGGFGQDAGGNYGLGAGGNYGQGAGGNYGQGAGGNYGQGAGGFYGQSAGGNYGQQSMQGDSRNFGPPQNPPPQQNYGAPRVGSPQQNYGPPRVGPSQQNYGPPGAGRDATPMSYSPAGNENYQGDRRDPLPDN